MLIGRMSGRQLKVGTIGLPIQFMRRTFHEIEYEQRYLSVWLRKELRGAWAILEQQGVDRSKVESSISAQFLYLMLKRYV